MNIGEEKQAIVAEPVEDPFEAPAEQAPTPINEEDAVFAPVIGDTLASLTEE